MLKHHKIEQNTDKWLSLRQGKFTASSFKNLFADKKTATYKNEIYRVAYEILTGESPESFSNDYMERGHDLEPFAVQEFELQTFLDTQPGGFFELNKYVGCSPDRLIGDDNGLEIKSPKFSTHIKYLLDEKLPAEYFYQVHGSLYVTGRKKWYFMSFHPKLESMILEIFPDQKVLDDIDRELQIAIKSVKEIVKRLEKRKIK